MGKIEQDDVLDVLIEYARLFVPQLDKENFYTFYDIDSSHTNNLTYWSTFGTNVESLTTEFGGKEEKVSAAMHTFLRVVQDNSRFINEVDKYLHTKDFIRHGVDCRAIAWTDIAKPAPKNKDLLMKIAKTATKTATENINELSHTELFHIIRYLNVSKCNGGGNDEKTKVGAYIDTCIITGE